MRIFHRCLCVNCQLLSEMQPEVVQWATPSSSRSHPARRVATETVDQHNETEMSTERNSHTEIQTIHPLGFGIRQSSFGSTPCINSPQHPANYTEQRSTNHHRLRTNNTNKERKVRYERKVLNSHYTTILTCEGYNF